MSRIGRKLLVLPKGVTLAQKAGAGNVAATVTVKGPKGELNRAIPVGNNVKVDGTKVTVGRADDTRENRAKHGLVRAHLGNMVKGVTDGWTRELEINGVGYRAEVSGDAVTMALGYSHPVVFKLPKGIAAKVEKNRLVLSGADRDV